MYEVIIKYPNKTLRSKKKSPTQLKKLISEFVNNRGRVVLKQYAPIADGRIKVLKFIQIKCEGCTLTAKFR